VAHEGAAYARATTGFSLRLDGATIHFFAPPSPTVLVDGPAPWSARGEEPSGDELNGSSLVAFVTVGTVDMLLPGDAEADVLQRYRLPPAEVLVVPHHGSRGGVTSDLLRQLGTRAAFISVGAGNPFGHPAPATLATLREAVGCVLRTDKSGWVSCTVQGEQMTISAEHMPVTDTQRTQATR
jgi:competence protein ComEC